jgi:hypothetical protein
MVFQQLAKAQVQLRLLGSINIIPMKNYTFFFILFFAFASFQAHGQADAKKNIISSEYIYCELIDKSTFLYGGTSEAPKSERRTTTFLIFGPLSDYQNKAKDRQHVSSLKDGMDALDYMSENGWEPIFRDIRTISSSTLETTYLLRKKKLPD